MLRQRIITALAIIVPVFLLIVFAPTWLFGLFVLAVVGLGAWEWARLGGFHSSTARLGYVASALALFGALLLVWLTAGWSTWHWAVLVLAVLWWLFVFLGLAWYRQGLSGNPSGRLLLQAAGMLTLVPAGLALTWLHATAPLLVLYLILLVGAADTGAYFAGRQFGRSKLAPEISPGKTREGLFGALFLVIPVGLLGAWLFGLAAMDALVFGLLSIVVALVSVAGDLQESVLKREAGAKDSGTLLPGHGGVLDRIDSLTAAAPVFLFGLLWTALLPAAGH
ncbi:phosphatidate cytidylyltransferase [Thioalkalivibrio sp.]|uniref:phosphatidate cytidylyltransferase n=1 Tax=Thioalkalivibrio sp. TaxID=2093813 RepID=UPI0012D57FA5|nr:phosphatidate cytidylyltransferase [Thioalkalivibrio sp.]TVP82220.1 MAG: phosphatidate cytidylyltransferase [Thioalkalivibrio sp.]